jgi:transcriptional repressor NrdR
MRCRKCGGDTLVVDSRYVRNEDRTRRRHECVECKYRFTTYEITEIALADLQMAKRVRDRLIMKIEQMEKLTKGE